MKIKYIKIKYIKVKYIKYDKEPNTMNVPKDISKYKISFYNLQIYFI